jgi:4-amino-4-deoxy-L-arabinose transferase-like glycosyltransferase
MTSSSVYAGNQAQPLAEDGGRGASRRRWLLVSILVLATFFRFYHFTITPPGLYADEAMNGNNAAEVAQTGHFRVFYSDNNGREGLYVNLLAVVMRFLPIREPWVVRVPAAIAGILTVYGLYFLASELFEYDVGLLAAFLLATSFWHVDFSRIAYRAILAPLFLTWSIYFLVKALHEDNAKSRAPGDGVATAQGQYFRSPSFFAAVAGVIYGLGFYSYISYRITPLIFLIFIPFFRRNASFAKRVTTFVLCAFITAAPLGYYFVKHPEQFFGRMSQLSVSTSPHPLRQFAGNLGKTLLMFNVHGDDNWGHNIRGTPELPWPVGILFLVGIIMAIRALVTRSGEDDGSGAGSLRSRFGLCLVFLWFLLTSIPAAGSIEGIPTTLRSLLMLPPALVLAAVAGVWIYRKVHEHAARGAPLLAAVFVVAITGLTYYRYFVVWPQNPGVHLAFLEKYVEIGREINALPATTPKYVIVTAGGPLVRGIPAFSQTTMFITDSFSKQRQAERNIRYLLRDQIDSIPPGTPKDTISYVQYPP